MVYGELNGHVIDDVAWPWKVKLVTQIRLEPNISKTARDAICNNRYLLDILLWGSTVGYIYSDSLPFCFVSICKTARYAQ